MSADPDQEAAALQAKIKALKNLVSVHESKREQQSEMEKIQSKIENIKRVVYGKKKKRKRQEPCRFFRTNGKCRRGEDCPFIHDSRLVPICSLMLKNGSCPNRANKTCTYSHEVDKNKLPDCIYFQADGCVNGAKCMYRHVKFNESTPICEKFSTGYCTEGLRCLKRHELGPAKKKKKKTPTEEIKHEEEEEEEEQTNAMLDRFSYSIPKPNLRLNRRASLDSLE